MNGFCRNHGLVVGEACRVRMLPLPPEVDYIGQEFPPELFERTLDASVFQVGGQRSDGTWKASVRLSDAWLESSNRAFLRQLFGAKPPSPYPYEIVPRHFLNGTMRGTDLREGAKCFIWIKAPGNVPGLHRDLDQLPSAFPGYPSRQLEGFWKARLVTVPETRGEATVRKVRAVFADDRIRDHELGRVRELLGHEPWEEYAVTATNDELEESSGEVVGRVTDKTAQLGAGAKVVLNDALKRVRDLLS